jgi:hypothetical protein
MIIIYDVTQRAVFSPPPDPATYVYVPRCVMPIVYSRLVCHISI